MKNLFKLFFFLSVLFSSTLYAAAHYYVAGNAGIFQGDFNNSYIDQTDIISQSIEQFSSQRGYTGGLALGFSKECFTSFFWGGELSANVEGHEAVFKSGANSTAFSDTAEVQYHIDLIFVPGVKLVETIEGYIKLGVSYASIQDKLISPINYTPHINEYDANEHEFGFAAGLGVKKLITKQFSIFTEANYHDYGVVDFMDFQNFTASYTHEAHVYTYDMVVGLSYQLA